LITKPRTKFSFTDTAISRSAWGADPSNESKAGKSYVIFGKTDNTAINLSAIASGTEGFVINGENADDYSGFIVSTTIKSSKPSPLTSPAVETEEPLKSSSFSPIMTKPPVPPAIADRLIAVLSVLPKTT
jgi:hypothetical protein